jgi:hypothetical protein
MRASIVVAAAGLLTAALRAQTAASFRVLLGVTDTAVTRWDGTVSARNGGSCELQPWRFEGVDNISGSLFHLSTHPARLFNAAALANASLVPNGFIINAKDVTESTEFAITTAQGDFSFRASDVTYGNGSYKLGGRAYVDRVPASERLSETPQEEDYPSIATAPSGDAWIAYMQFHHSDDHNKLRANLHEDPKSYSQYKTPPGGDQVWARKYSGRSWAQPVEITPAGGDLYRPAVAVDAQGRAWVFWSENRGGNFDIYARPVDNSGARDKIQISSEPGSDIDAVAVRDSSGKVWVAWQGWRNGRAAIFAAQQEGSRFSKPFKVSNSNANEWNPAIAASKDGRVAIAWDSYRSGNYDVYVRTHSSGNWSNEVPVAASARYEAYPSIAYDPTGRLWIAYEEGGRGWGKDFGAYNTTGIALYQGRLVRLRGLESNGRLISLNANLDESLVGAPTHKADRTGSQSDSASPDPDPQNAQHRKADATAVNNIRAAKNSLARVTVDDSGRIWLAFRTAHPIWWSPLGTVWTEDLVSFNGKQWSKPIFLNHSDNLLDNRPALALLASGKLLVVNSSDGRRDLQISQRMSDALGLSNTGAADPYNNDLWSTTIDLGPGNQVIPIVPANAQRDAPTVDAADAALVKAIHDYRGSPDGNLHIVRGEFHRHSEVSMDGGNDGTLLDQWRYILDASALDWAGCCDHDNGGGREYTWWLEQKLTDIFHAPGQFVPMFSYERSVPYPEGHRNVIFAQRGVRTLPRLPISGENDPVHAPDTQMLYGYLREFNGIVASHTSATAMGTDWRDNDPSTEPAVEIYQGDRQNYEIEDGPRANTEKDSIGGWRPKGLVRLALDKGYRLGFESSSDHISTHISYGNLYVKDLTRASVLEALQKRHVYAATDNILADVESGSHLMGDEFSSSELPSLRVKLKGTSRFAKVVIVKDGKYVYSTSPNSETVDFSWRDNQPDKGKTSYYYVRGEQDNGEIVWVSPLWIKYTGD